MATVAQFRNLKGSNRLSHYAMELGRQGVNVSTEYWPNPNGGTPYAAYHVFTDPDEDAAWVVKDEEEQKLRLKHKKEAEEAVALRRVIAAKAKAAREDKKKADEAAEQAAEAQRIANQAAGVRHGQWSGGKPLTSNVAPHKIFATTSAKPVGVSPSPATRQRLDEMQRPTAGVEPQPKGSAPGVPAAELDKAFPRARSKDVVEFAGITYRRGFRALVRDAAGRVTKWDPYWAVIDERKAA